jgi:hypothetical protein
VASTQHALRTLPASLRSAKRPRTQFANSPKYKYKVPEVQVSEIQVFFGQVRTRTPFKRRKSYSPTSRQVRVLIKQAPVAAYLQDLPSRFFFLQFAQREKAKNSYRRATYQGNFSSVLNQEFFFFGSRVAMFTSNLSCLKYWLLRHFLYGRRMRRQYWKWTTLCSKSSTIKGLLYTPDSHNHKKGTLSDQP